MTLEIWTILNPIIRTLIYFTALYSIGSVLFKVHFYKFFNEEINVYCKKIIRNSALLGFIISILAFLSVAGNLGGEIKSILEIDLIKLSFETMQGKSYLLLIVGFSFLCFSYYFKRIFMNAFNIIGTVLIFISFIVIGHSLSQGIYTQILLLIHLFCISYWLGSFFPLRHMCNKKNYKNLYLVAHNFGVYATFYVGLLVITGLTFSYFLLGGILPILTSTYGNVLLCKLLLVSSILMIGAINKFRIVPKIKGNLTLGQSKLKRSINIEFMLTWLILFLTSILTTSLPTPMGM